MIDGLITMFCSCVFAVQLTRLLDVELACEGRQWMVHACSRKDVKSIREAFEKFGDMLLPKDGATAAQEPSAENVNRI